MIEVVKPADPVDDEIFSFVKFPYGINKAVSSSMLQPEELSDCVDFINKKGKLISRPALVRASTVAITGSVQAVENAVVGGVNQTIVGGADGKIYYMNGTVPTLIGSCEGIPFLVPFLDACLICDGSHLKFVKDTTAVRIAYDTGDGGVQYDNMAGTQDGGLRLNGTSARVGVDFTSETWTSGYTIPPTQIEAYLKRTGAAAGVITARVRLKSDDSILCEKTLTQDAGDISESGELVTVIFDTVTTEMEPATGYYAEFEFTGTSSAYIELMCTAVASGGHGAHFTTVWVADLNLDPVMQVRPGLPPKCSHGCVADRRPELAGDPDNPGWTWSGNYTYLDFSSENIGKVGGGHIGAVDNNRNSFEVGAINSLYGKLFSFGKEDQPFLSRREGESPVDFSYPAMFHQNWTTHRTLINTKNDLFFASEDGVGSLQGVVAYGDIRSFSESDRIEPIIERHWDSATAFAGYDPAYGQYLLYLPSYGKILVCHTRSPFRSGDSDRIEYPWGEYSCPVTPSCFGKFGNSFATGGADGYLYKNDPTAIKDLETESREPFFVTRFKDILFSKAELNEFQPMAHADLGATLEVSIFKERQEVVPCLTFPVTLSVFDGLLIEDATFLVEDAIFPVDGSQTSLGRVLNIEASSVKVKVQVKNIRSGEVLVDGGLIKYTPIPH
ncbi:MAG: hypothetical protein JEZ12_21595 [Desulfobacterium sp.]|nr:hypothetical protein [Desulfobacterium sp.]